MRVCFVLLCLLLGSTSTTCWAQGSGEPPPLLQACTCLIPFGSTSCFQLHGAWSPPPSYPCANTLCVSDACPLSKELTRYSVHASAIDWDTARSKYKLPTPPAQGEMLRELSDQPFWCKQEYHCVGCLPMPPRVNLPAGSYCTSEESGNSIGIPRYVVCKDEQGQPLPPCDGPGDPQ